MNDCFLETKMNIEHDGLRSVFFGFHVSSRGGISIPTKGHLLVLRTGSRNDAAYYIVLQAGRNLKFRSINIFFLRIIRKLGLWLLYDGCGLWPSYGRYASGPSGARDDVSQLLVVICLVDLNL